MLKNFLIHIYNVIGILDYMQKTLVDMKDEMGIYLYNNSNILEDQIEKESTSISYDYPKTNKNSNGYQ